MKFQLAINMERIDDSLDMTDVANHTLEMVKMADRGGFNIVWAAEHHSMEMTIAPNPFQILTCGLTIRKTFVWVRPSRWLLTGIRSTLPEKPR